MILDTLNIEQREAVVYPNGPLLVLSGAGTGKTRVLTARFAYLVEKKGVNPHTIMAVTFTNKAANEIKNRVSNELNLPINSHWIGTFHAIFSKFLRKHSSIVGLKSNFTILDIDDQKKLVKQVISFLKLDNDLSENIILSEIQNLKDLGSGYYFISNHPIGDNITIDDLEIRSPCRGLPAGSLTNEIQLTRPAKKGEALSRSHFTANITLEKQLINQCNQMKISLPVRLHDYLEIEKTFHLENYEWHLSFTEVPMAKEVILERFRKEIKNKKEKLTVMF